MHATLLQDEITKAPTSAECPISGLFVFANQRKNRANSNMMREKILHELKVRAAKSGCSERTIQNYGENIPMPADESVLTEEFYNGHVAILNSIGGQINRHVSEQVAEFKKNFKPEQQQSTAGEVPDAIKELRETVQALQTRLEQEAKEKARTEKLKAAEKLMVAQGADDVVIRELAMAKVHIDDNDTAESIASKGKALYDTKFTEHRGNGATPTRGNGNFNASKVNFDDLKSHYRKSGMLPAENQSN